MAIGMARRVGREAEGLFAEGSTAGLSDAALLARFVAGSGSAFEALVGRHGRMVRGVCRRIVADAHAAEDAFQAVFLVLVRRAGSVRVDDSLGRWLHGVSVRVARRARERSIRDRSSGISAEPSARDPEPAEAEAVRAAIDEEIARLPSSYRDAVVLCHLEGLTREAAAARLGRPVGTVNSRLSRATDLLRSRLVRRGLAPASGGLAVWLGLGLGPAARASAPPLSIAIATPAGMVPTGVVALARTLPGRPAMLARIPIGTMILLVSTGLGATVMARHGGGRGGAIVQQPTPSVAKPAPPPLTTADRYKALSEEWEAAKAACFAAMGAGKTKAQQNEIFGRLYPNDLTYARGFLDIAHSASGEPGARDAALWLFTLLRSTTEVEGEPSDLVAEAITLLVAHHADDPAVATAALGLDNGVSRNRDKLFRPLYEKATDPTSKGIACLALAQYLEQKAKMVKSSHLSPTPPTIRYQMYDDNNKGYLKDGPKFCDDAYWAHLRSCSDTAMRQEAIDLYRKVIADHGEITFPARGGRPAKTAASIAEGHLDEIAHIAVGQPAPEIDGKDMDGKPRKLSDYRGKVVALVFWGTWCGPCMSEVPHEREMVERLKGKPFAMLGVDCDEDVAKARKVMTDERITWPNWNDGEPGSGPIASTYHIRGYPTVVVIDARGIIRQTRVGGESLDKAVDKLLDEMGAGKVDAAGSPPK